MKRKFGVMGMVLMFIMLIVGCATSSGTSSATITAKAYLDRGMKYAQEGDADKALANFNEAIKLEPDNDTAYFYRGNIYNMRNDLENAISDYLKAVALNSTYKAAWYSLGNVYAKKGDYDSAIEAYESALLIVYADSTENDALNTRIRANKAAAEKRKAEAQ